MGGGSAVNIWTWVAWVGGVCLCIVIILVTINIVVVVLRNIRRPAPPPPSIYPPGIPPNFSEWDGNGRRG